jgi:hypothetical protein
MRRVRNVGWEPTDTVDADLVGTANRVMLGARPFSP